MGFGKVVISFTSILLQIQIKMSNSVILCPTLIVQTAVAGEGFYCFHDSESEEATVFPDFRTFNNLKTLQVHEAGAGLPVYNNSFHKLLDSNCIRYLTTPGRPSSGS